MQCLKIGVTKIRLKGLILGLRRKIKKQLMAFRNIQRFAKPHSFLLKKKSLTFQDRYHHRENLAREMLVDHIRQLRSNYRGGESQRSNQGNLSKGNDNKIFRT